MILRIRSLLVLSIGFFGVMIDGFKAENDYVDHLIREHMKIVMEQIQKESPVLRDLERNGSLLIVGVRTA